MSKYEEAAKWFDKLRNELAIFCEKSGLIISQDEAVHYDTIREALARMVEIEEGKSVVVPVEPTFDMVYAAHKVTEKSERWNWCSIYKAMIAAREGK